jgi:hypothetical protein
MHRSLQSHHFTNTNPLTTTHATPAGSPTLFPSTVNRQAGSFLHTDILILVLRSHTSTRHPTAWIHTKATLRRQTLTHRFTASPTRTLTSQRNSTHTTTSHKTTHTISPRARLQQLAASHIPPTTPPTPPIFFMAELNHTMTDPNQSIINHTMTDPNTTLPLDEVPESLPAAPKGILKTTSDQTPSGGASK